MNIKWQAQDVDYIEKDVGIGGTVSVLIVPKGDYINITKVDMKSAVKGKPEVNQGAANVARILTEGKPNTEKFRTPKEMTANNLTAIFCRNMSLITTEPKFVLDAYNYFLKHLGEL